MTNEKYPKNKEKPSNQVASSYLHIEVTRRQKSRWVKAAQRHGLKLAEFVIARLDNKL